MPYRFVEGLTRADVAFEATGKTLEEMFISAADAVTATEVENPEAITAEVEKRFELRAGELDRLLHDFLQEMIFYKDAELLIFKEYALEIAERDGGYLLKAVAKGEVIDTEKHHMLVDVKAVSWHMFKLERTADGWKALIIIDV